jgi:hypothetical protein
MGVCLTAKQLTNSASRKTLYYDIRVHIGIYSAVCVVYATPPPDWLKYHYEYWAVDQVEFSPH